MNSGTTETVSVVIPAYNAEKYLGKAIESVLRQQHPRIEIIVVDDGSADTTCSVARKFRGVRCFQQPNRGIAASRNQGVELATGPLLAFLDADDLWTDNKLKRQLDYLRNHPDVQIVAGQVEQFYDPGLHLPADVQPPAATGAYTAGTILMRRDDFFRVGWFDTALVVGEFVDWHSRAVSLGLREHALDEVLLRRRIHDSNTTLQRKESLRDFLPILRAHLDRKRRAA